MIEVLIFPGYGGANIPKEVTEIIKDIPFPQCRTGDVIDYLKGLPIATGDLQGELDKLEEGEILRLSEDRFAFGGSLYSSSAKIVNVDNSKPWRISEYDGAEAVEYLNFRIIDRDMNYCEI